jgi:hypothetical protein
MRSIPCGVCGGTMKKTSMGRGNIVGLLAALFFVGIGVALCFTGIGALIGIPLIIIGLFTGGKKRKVWRCRQCRAIVERG